MSSPWWTGEATNHIKVICAPKATVAGRHETVKVVWVDGLLVNGLDVWHGGVTRISDKQTRQGRTSLISSVIIRKSFMGTGVARENTSPILILPVCMMGWSGHCGSNVWFWLTGCPVGWNNLLSVGFLYKVMYWHSNPVLYLDCSPH